MTAQNVFANSFPASDGKGPLQPPTGSGYDLSTVMQIYLFPYDPRTTTPNKVWVALWGQSNLPQPPGTQNPPPFGSLPYLQNPQSYLPQIQAWLIKYDPTYTPGDNSDYAWAQFYAWLKAHELEMGLAAAAVTAGVVGLHFS